MQERILVHKSLNATKHFELFHLTAVLSGLCNMQKEAKTQCQPKSMMKEDFCVDETLYCKKTPIKLFLLQKTLGPSEDIFPPKK